MIVIVFKSWQKFCAQRLLQHHSMCIPRLFSVKWSLQLLYIIIIFIISIRIAVLQLMLPQ